MSVSAAKAGAGRQVVVGRQLGQPARARAVGRHPPGEAGELEEELGRVVDLLRQHVREARPRGVGELEHQQVLDAAPGAAEHHAAVRLGDAVEAGDHLLQQLAVEGHRAGGERRRQEALGAARRRRRRAGRSARRPAAWRSRPASRPGASSTAAGAGDLDLLGLAAALHRVAHPLDPAAVARAGRRRRAPGRSSRRRASRAAAPAAPRPAGVSRAIATGSGGSMVSGMAKGVPSGRMPRASVTATRPASSSAASSVSARKPQALQLRRPAARRAPAPRCARSCCWKCCGRRKSPSDQSTRFASLMPAAPAHAMRELDARRARASRRGRGCMPGATGTASRQTLPAGSRSEREQAELRRLRLEGERLRRAAAGRDRAAGPCRPGRRRAPSPGSSCSANMSAELKAPASLQPQQRQRHRPVGAVRARVHPRRAGDGDGDRRRPGRLAAAGGEQPGAAAVAQERASVACLSPSLS